MMLSRLQPEQQKKKEQPSAALSSQMCEFFNHFISRCVERLGYKKLWKVVRLLRELPLPVSPHVVRDQLRNLNIFISDNDFTNVTEVYCVEDESAFDVNRFITDFFHCTLSARRWYVIALILRKLGINEVDITKLISFENVLKEFSVYRHPFVVNGYRAADDVIASFVDDFEMEQRAYEENTNKSCNNENINGNTATDNEMFITGEELIAYYIGVSYHMPNDTDFELRCTRSFALDVSNGMNAEHDASELTRMQGSRAMSRKSQLLGMKKVHPLYTTTNSDYGKTVINKAAEVPNLYKLSEHGRSQHLTRNLPPRIGGATSMNM